MLGEISPKFHPYFLLPWYGKKYEGDISSTRNFHFFRNISPKFDENNSNLMDIWAKEHQLVSDGIFSVKFLDIEPVGATRYL